MGEIQTGRIQGGTHEETPRPGTSGMDRATFFLTEVGVKVGVIQAKVTSAKEVELVYGESECPRDVSPMERGRFEFLWGFFGFSSARVRHGIVFKLLIEWLRL